MSKTIGIIAEYNPFHSGHAYQIDFLRQNGYEKIAVAMSGSCVQRGEIALLSKFDRAKMAVDYGVSLVCEIPVPYSALSAESFACAGITLLKNLGVDAVCFGSESGDISLLQDIASFLLSDRYEDILKEFLGDNIPFAIARQRAILSCFDIGQDILNSSNDILAIEYIKESIKQNWHPEFIPIKRIGANYNDTLPKNGFAAASYIRNCVKNFSFEQALQFIPQINKDFFSHILDTANYFAPDTAFEKALLYSLRKTSAQDFYMIPECNKELAHSFENAITISSSIEEIFNNLPTKRYTRARLKRIMLFSFLDIKNDCPKTLPFIRILAMDNMGQEILKYAKEVSNLPISHSYRQLQDIDTSCKKIIEYEACATNTQATFFKYIGEMSKDYTTKLYKKI